MFTAFSIISMLKAAKASWWNIYYKPHNIKMLVSLLCAHKMRRIRPDNFWCVHQQMYAQKIGISTHINICITHLTTISIITVSLCARARFTASYARQLYANHPYVHTSTCRHRLQIFICLHANHDLRCWCLSRSAAAAANSARLNI